MTWQAPPPRRGNPPDPVLVEAVREMQGRPLEWKLVKSYQSLSAANITARKFREGGVTWGPVGRYEATVRGTDLYVRYMGESA